MPKRHIKYTTYNDPVTKRPKTFKSVVIKQTKPSVQAMVRRAVARSRETKMVTNQSVEAPMSSLVSEYFYNAPVPTTGTGSNNRIGNRVDPTSLSCKFLLHNNMNQVCHVRCMLIEIYSGLVSNGSIQADFLESSTGTDSAPVGSLSDLIRKTNREEFRIIREEIITVGRNNSADAMGEVAHRAWYTKLTKPMIWNDSSTAEQQTSRYAIVFMVRQANGDESTGNTVEVSIDFDMYYKD